MKTLEILSKNPKDTENIAKTFLKEIVSKKGKEASSLSGASVVGLYGNLGAGKTTFTQSFSKILGVKRKVNSPTFVIMKRYSLGKNSKTRWTNLFHIDAYRLKNEKELLNLGWEEIISNPDNLVFIEWPENIAKAMPKKHFKIKISHLARSSDKTDSKEEFRKFKINF